MSGHKLSVMIFLFLLSGLIVQVVGQGYESDHNRPKNIILIIGDGMGDSHLTALTRLKKRDKLISRFPVVGFQKTFSSDDLITDSAASGTAMACGVKTYNGAIGVDKDTMPVKNILEKVASLHMATGIVVSSSIVHGTPASFYAHVSSRLYQENIALDLVKTAPDFIVGGGKYFFTARRDDRNIAHELEDNGYQVYDFFNNELSRLSPDPRSKFCYFSAEREPIGAHFGRRFLPVAVNKALKFLPKRSDRGFFLMIEASQIDWASHNRSGGWLDSELMDLRAVLSEVIKFAVKDGKTLVILTGDHETGGLSITKRSKLGALHYEFAINDHTGEMIPVLAMGPGSEYFNGIYDNTQIHQKMWDLINGYPLR